jgi:hypothetical protein
MIVRLILAVFLLAHGLIHALFVVPAPESEAERASWPFELADSWILRPLGLDAALARPLGSALVVLTVVAFAVAAILTLGVGPAAWWAPAVAIASIVSLAVLVLFFDRWLLIGVAIDAVLLWVALASGWTPADAALA